MFGKIVAGIAGGFLIAILGAALVALATVSPETGETAGAGGVFFGSWDWH